MKIKINNTKIRDLYTNTSTPQEVTAERLGVTQSMISRYRRNGWQKNTLTDLQRAIELADGDLEKLFDVVEGEM